MVFHSARRFSMVALGSALAVTATVAPAQAAPKAAPQDAKLQQALDAVHKAGMIGIYSAVRKGGNEWRGASGFADVKTKEPATPDHRHRVGSITKTFTATAVLQQVEKGRIRLDAPISRYLPGLVPGTRGRKVTVRMLLNHTSGIGDYVLPAFPSLAKNSPKSLDANRYKAAKPTTLIRLGLKAPATGRPGKTWSYSNTNYIILGELLRKTTRTDPGVYITENIIRKAGLQSTFYPTAAEMPAPYAKAYENLYGFIDPPKDYSTFHPSWLGTAGAVISTMGDLNAFYKTLLDGRLISKRSLTQMKRTFPIKDEKGKVVGGYGLGLYPTKTPCGTFWGHDGGVFGHVTISATRADLKRQASTGMNLTNYNRLDAKGNPKPHKIDAAVARYIALATCDSTKPLSTRLPTPAS